MQYNTICDLLKLNQLQTSVKAMLFLYVYINVWRQWIFTYNECVRKLLGIWRCEENELNVKNADECVENVTILQCGILYGKYLICLSPWLNVCRQWFYILNVWKLLIYSQMFIQINVGKCFISHYSQMNVWKNTWFLSMECGEYYWV